MKALFCYDGPLYRDEFGEYYDSILNDQMFERYFKIVDYLNVFIRVREIDRDKAINTMDKICNPNIQITEFPNLSSICSLMTNKKIALRLLKDKIIQSDIVFIRLPSVIGNYAVDVCEKHNIKYIVEVVGCPWDSYTNYSNIGKIVAPYAFMMMKRRVQNAPHVIYVTNNFLQNRYPTRGKYINCSNVELQKFDNQILMKRLIKISKYKKETKYMIGTAAGLDVLYKGQQYVIQALGEMKKSGITNIEYQLIGGGNGKRLKELAVKLNVEDQVKIIGLMPHDQVYKWLDELDIYIQPSRQEGLPRSVIEAMSRAVPCMGAKTAGIPELIDESYLFANTKNEYKEIIKILNRLISKKDELSECAERNFSEAKKYQKTVLSERRTHFLVECVND